MVQLECLGKMFLEKLELGEWLRPEKKETR